MWNPEPGSVVLLTGGTMPNRSRLASLSIGALVKMRNEIGAILSRKANAMKKELRAIGEDYKEVGRIAIYGKKKAKATKRVSAAKRESTAKRAPKASARTPDRRKRKRVAGRRRAATSRA
jgi:hypothetical protein